MAKPLTEFHRRRGNADGLQMHCKSCTRQYQRARMAARAARIEVTLPQDEGKKCPRCGEFKPWSVFAKNRSAKDGHQSYCRPCSARVQREYFDRNADAIALRYAERRARQADTEGLKRCRKCGETKPLLAFYAHQTTKDGRANYCIECQCSASRDWHARNPDAVKRNNESQRHRDWKLQQFGLTSSSLKQMLEEQSGVCAICEKPETRTDPRNGQINSLAIDHDHNTGRVRGLLCGSCNTGLGLLGDNEQAVQRAIDYLRRARDA